MMNENTVSWINTKIPVSLQLLQEVAIGGLLIIVEEDSVTGIETLFKQLGSWEKENIRVDPLVGQLYAYWQFGVPRVPVFEGKVLAAPLYRGSYAPSESWAFPAIVERLRGQEGAIVALASSAEAVSLLEGLRRVVALRRVSVATLAEDGSLQRLSLDQLLSDATQVGVLTDTGFESAVVPVVSGESEERQNLALSWDDWVYNFPPESVEGVHTKATGENVYGENINALGYPIKIEGEAKPRILLHAGGTLDNFRQHIVCKVLPLFPQASRVCLLDTPENWFAQGYSSHAETFGDLQSLQGVLDFGVTLVTKSELQRTPGKNSYKPQKAVYIGYATKENFELMRDAHFSEAVVILWAEDEDDANYWLSTKSLPSNLISNVTVYKPVGADYILASTFSNTSLNLVYKGYGLQKDFGKGVPLDALQLTRYYSGGEYPFLHEVRGWNFDHLTDGYSREAALDVALTSGREGTFTLVTAKETDSSFVRSMYKWIHFVSQFDTGSGQSTAEVEELKEYKDFETRCGDDIVNLLVDGRLVLFAERYTLDELWSKGVEALQKKGVSIILIVVDGTNQLLTRLSHLFYGDATVLGLDDPAPSRSSIKLDRAKIPSLVVNTISDTNIERAVRYLLQDFC